MDTSIEKKTLDLFEILFSASYRKLWNGHNQFLSGADGLLAKPIRDSAFNI